MRLAVLGDVHGHLTLAFRVLRRWQDETGLALDLILQVGDMGAYPPPFRLDEATRRFAERDPDELGFAAYYQGDPEAAEIFGPDALPARALGCELWFIKGNHEDFVFLEEISVGSTAGQPIPVDPFGAIRFLPSGGIYPFEREGRTLRIAALGGISDRGRPGTDRESEHYTAHDIRALKRGPYDILLSHEPPHGVAAALHPRYADSGSPGCTELLHTQRPALHFCGHYHEPGAALPAPHGVASYQLNAVGFLRGDRLNPGCIAIVTWPDGEPPAVELLEAPWLREYTRHTYRHL